MKPRKLIKLHDLESFYIPTLPNFVRVVFAGHKEAMVDMGSLSDCDPQIPVRP